MSDHHPVQLSPVALFRYQVVAAVETLVLAGVALAWAIAEAASQAFLDPCGRPRRVSQRTIYRWLRAYRECGLAGLEVRQRRRLSADRPSEVLSQELIAFLRQHKSDDPDLSIPHLLELATAEGLLRSTADVDRVTVWRALRRMGLLTCRRRQADADMRRFGFPHRMLMVLADGKRFRAGVKRLRRVALTFIDDATRFGLGGVVGTSESVELFLPALFDVVLHHGLMVTLFVDRGPGFIGNDTLRVAAQLPCNLIHGTANYPEGHGKVEKFHQLLISRVLRGLDSNPEVDADCGALTLRLTHWLREVYNHRPHEALGGDSPAQRWAADERSLKLPDSREILEQRFTLSISRRVTSDNTISYKAVAYEMPRGYRGRRVTLSRHLLESDALSFIHHGRRLRLAPVDRTANAYDRRRGRRKRKAKNNAPTPPATTAAQRAFDDDFGPIVDPDGGYPQEDEE